MIQLPNFPGCPFLRQPFLHQHPMKIKVPVPYPSMYGSVLRIRIILTQIRIRILVLNLSYTDLDSASDTAPDSAPALETGENSGSGQKLWLYMASALSTLSKFNRRTVFRMAFNVASTRKVDSVKLKFEPNSCSRVSIRTGSAYDLVLCIILYWHQ